MKKNALFLVAVMLIIGAIAGVGLSLWLVPNNIEKIITYNASIKVDEKFGFNADNDKLYFGIVKPYSESDRVIFLENNQSYPVQAVIRAQGALKDWISYSQNPVELPPFTKKNVTITAIGNTEQYGQYDGKIVITFRKK